MKKSVDYSVIKQMYYLISAISEDTQKVIDKMYDLSKETEDDKKLKRIIKKVEFILETVEEFKSISRSLYQDNDSESEENSDK